MSKEVVISEETKVIVGEIEEYLKGNTAYTADQWVRGKISEVKSSDVSEEELVALRRETEDLISKNVRTSLMVDGVRMINRSTEGEVGGLKVLVPRQEFLIPPDAAPAITGQEDIESVHYQQNPDWKSAKYDARMVVRLRGGNNRMVIAFEKDRVTRVKESLKNVEPDGTFGFKVSGIEQKIDRYPLTKEESVLVRSALAGLNSHLRERQNSMITASLPIPASR